MPKLQLPYLTSSLTETGRTGKIKFGWCETVTEIEECDPREFRLAVTRFINSENSRSIYVRDNAFWVSAIRPIRDRCDLAGIEEETTFSANPEFTAWFLEGMASDVMEERLDARAIAAGSRLARDYSSNIKIRSRLKSGDGHEGDLEHFTEWTRDNLLWADGRLMKRLHSPSICISWNFAQHGLTNTSTLNKMLDDNRPFGTAKPRPGLHFRPDDPAVEEYWAEAKESFTASSPELRDSIYIADAMTKALGAMPDRDQFAKHDNLLLSMTVLESLSPEGWEDMETRSAESFAYGVARNSASHFRTPGPLRDALEEIKTLCSIPSAERPGDFHDRLEAAISTLPGNENSIRTWFSEKILDRWADRSISLQSKTWGL